ncbi:MAG: hypothetical protein IKL96_06905 [Kiritimatiellae bacterium]|nr:hypothetical protein [Kiritimatiellia bacterium]
MKRLMMIAWMAVATGLVAAEAAPKQHLVAAAYIAPFSEITQTATAVGTMFNQPMMPVMAMAAAQQALAKDYGPIDGAQPVYALVYLDTAKVAALDFAAGRKNDLDDIADGALLYPVAGGESAFMAVNTGAVKSASGVIMLSGKKKTYKYARFTDDGRYCAFAKSTAIALRAAGDVARAKDWLKSPKPALTRVFVNGRGVNAIATIVDKAQAAQEKQLQSAEMDAGLAKTLASIQAIRKNQFDVLRSIGSLKVALGFDDKGLALWGGASLRKGAALFVPAGAAITGKAFDEIPAGAGLTIVQNSLAQLQGKEIGDYTKMVTDLFGTLRTLLKDNKDERLAKYKQTLDDLLVALIDLYKSLDGVKVGPQDWGSTAFAFDAQKRPAVLVKGECSQIPPAVIAAPGKFLDRIIAILERQWPANGILRKLADGKYAFDWARLVDLAAKESDACSEGKSKTDPKEIAEVKDAIAKVLGGTVTEFSFQNGPKSGCAKLAAPGVSIAPAPAGQGAQRLFAAVPEADKAAVLGYFYTTPYALVRDVGMPIYLKFTSPEERQQYNAILAALPPAAPGGAFAGATWVRKDGALKFAMRLTADEIKTFGAVVTALGSAGDDDDDDE